tara:strand:+ start:769 stop:1407 length:639 start_codon:yes stop_codon:yes gene_type:complete
MVRITRVHTGIGDEGNTQHLDGTTVSKSDTRLEVVGTIDELNSIVGVIRMELGRLPTVGEDGGPKTIIHRVQAKVGRLLSHLQQELFDLGAECSTTPESIPEGMQVLPDSAGERLVKEMDEMLEVCEPLTSFILPTGNPVIAHLHMARSVTRRCERRLSSLREAEGANSVRGETFAYLNRLSDWFFVMARWIAATLGEDETLWKPLGRRMED